MVSDLLDLELRLLLARHGRSRVIEGLARVGQTTPEEIERAIGDFERGKLARKSKPQGSVESLLGALKIPRKEIADLVAKAAGLFEAKVIFPERRDAVAFLRRHGVEKSHAKSRREVLPGLLKVLSSLDEAEIREVIETCSATGESDYSLLANRIMGKSPAGMKKPFGAE